MAARGSSAGRRPHRRWRPAWRAPGSVLVTSTRMMLVPVTSAASRGGSEGTCSAAREVIASLSIRRTSVSSSSWLFSVPAVTIWTSDEAT